MARGKHFAKYIFTGLAAGSGAFFLYYSALNKDKYLVKALSPAPLPQNSNPHKWDSNWDRRNPEDIVNERGIKETDEKYQSELAKWTPKASRNLLLIRHGQYNLNGTTDQERYLTELGKMQAEFTGLRLQQLDLPYTHFIKSTMTRAQETGNIILQYLNGKSIPGMVDCSLLREGAPAPPEPAGSNKRPAVHYHVDSARIESAFRTYIHRADPRQIQDSYEIIICHANVIRYFVCRALQISPQAWLRFSLNHCSITWIKISPDGRVTVHSIGDSGHIPPQSITRS